MARVTRRRKVGLGTERTTAIVETSSKATTNQTDNRRQGNNEFIRTVPICRATLPWSKLRNTGESLTSFGSSVANSTAESRFSRSSGAAISTRAAKSSNEGEWTILRRQVSQTTTTTLKYAKMLSDHRVWSESTQLQSANEIADMKIRKLTMPAQRPRTRMNRRRRRPKLCSFLPTTGSRRVLIQITPITNQLACVTSIPSPTVRVWRQTTSSSAIIAYPIQRLRHYSKGEVN